jgi:glc operon protein GlcG
VGILLQIDGNRMFGENSFTLKVQPGALHPFKFPGRTCGTFHISNLTIMNQKPVLSIADLKRVAAACEAEAASHQWAVTFAIVDDGGHLLWLQRLDGAAPISSHIAQAKARTAALGRRESRVYEEMINQGRMSFLSAPVLDGMLEGGVPVLVAGHCIGAVGVSGVKSSEDAQIARAGIAALEL